MIDTSQEVKQQYLSSLLEYLTGRGEPALQRAYEVGRRAIAEGLGGLEMLAIHQQCLATALRSAETHQESSRIVEQGGNFFAESLAPFEMELRGFREANTRLGRNLADLQETKEKLLQQHNELRAANQALETERIRYRDLFDFAPDGYLVTDLEGRIEEANQAAGALLGARIESVTGSRLVQFVVEGSHHAFEARLERLPKDDAGKAQDWQFDICSQTGTSFPATLSVRVVRNASGLPVSLRWLLRDVTERKRMEDERAQFLVREQVARAQSEAAQRFAFLAEVSTLLVASLDCETTLGDVARRIVPYVADWCLIYALESDTSIHLLCAVPANNTDPDSLSFETAPLSPQSCTARVLAQGHGQIFHTTPGKSGEWMTGQGEPFNWLLKRGLNSMMLVPMQTQGRALGFIVLGAAQPDRYRDDHLALAEDLARRCALAVDNTRLYRAMTAERDKAAEASRAKDDFLAILSHELRNPLVPVLGWARNFKKSTLVAQHPVLSQGVEAIERNALNILRLADDCLDLVRISEHKVTLEKERLDLNRIVRGSIEALRHTAEEKGLQVVAQCSPASLWILGDRTRIEQVMGNLLINAIKYTETGGAISIRSSKIKGHAQIEIHDTGIGIAPGFLGQLFQPFRRGTKEWLTSDVGLGLGLAIARSIIEMHGGTIWAESPGLGRGSTFYVRMVLAPAEAPSPDRTVGASGEPAPVSSLCVLLIDDHKDVADLTKMELEELGYGVLTASDGHQGLEIAIREIPDVIISDIKMPRMDGYELIHSLRRIPGLAAVPVVALTGFGMKKDVEAAVAAGYDAHLNKPVDVNVLSELIQRLAAHRRHSNRKSD
jgi:PAS domain S-box-containing protein